MNNTPVYLDSYTLQSDMRIRLPKSVINNLQAVPGKTEFSFYFDSTTQSVIMKICDKKTADNNEVKNNG